MAAMILIAVTLFTVPTVPILWLLAAVLVVTGMAEGSVDVGSNAADMGSPQQSGALYAGAPSVLRYRSIHLTNHHRAGLQMTGGIRAPYWVLAFLALPVALWMALASPRPIHEDEERAVPARLIVVVMIALFLYFYVGAESGIRQLDYLCGRVRVGESRDRRGYLTSMFWGGLTLGRVFAIPIAARFSPESILLGDLVGSLVSVAVILVWRESSLAVWAGSLGVGVFMASVFPTVLLWAERRMTLTGSVTRWFFVGSSLGSMSFPWLIGQFFERNGPIAVMFIIFALIVANIAVFYLLMHYGGPARPDEAIDGKAHV